MAPGEHTLSEILSQPEAWAEGIAVARQAAGAFAELARSEPFDQVLLTGCGSTYYHAVAGAALHTSLTGAMARALPASELWFHPELAYPSDRRTLLVAVSRSGETSETINACRDFLAAGRGKLVTLTCYPESPLASMGHLNVVFTSGMEQSVAQTRSFATLYLGWAVLSAAAAGRDDLQPAFDLLPAAARRLLDRCNPRVTALAEDASIERFYFLGSGARYGLACELSLKMKEMSLSHSEPFHFMEFRHGPMSMVNNNTLIVALRSESDRQQETAVLDEMAAMGARLLVIDEAGVDDPALGFALQSGAPEIARGPLYLPAGQLLACRHALAKGLNPDRPANLESVVRL